MYAPVPTSGVNTADASGPERKAQHAAARLRTKQLCDIATLAWDAKLEGVVREACPLALALEWSGEVDPEVVRWQTEVTSPASCTLDLSRMGSNCGLDQAMRCKSHAEAQWSVQTRYNGANECDS